MQRAEGASTHAKGRRGNTHVEGDGAAHGDAHEEHRQCGVTPLRLCNICDDISDKNLEVLNVSAIAGALTEPHCT
jgi:hypothetical protein